MRGRAWQNLASIFFVSAGALTFEVVLTRVFSLMFWHHFASLLIALALTGFGTAGSLTAVLAPWLKRGRQSLLAATALGAAASMVLSYLAVLAVHLEPLSLAWSWRAWPDLGLVCLSLMIPFLLAAAHIALVLAWAKSVAQTYASNLAGSGAGCLIAAVALSHLPPHQAIYAAVGLTLLGFASQVPGLGPRPVRLLLVSAAGMGLLLVAAPLPLRFEPFKDRSAVLAAQGSRLEHRAVGLRGVVEVIGGPAFHYAPGLALGCPTGLRLQKGLFLDGDLLGAVSRLEPEEPRPQFVSCLLNCLPHLIFQPQRVLVVNPEGGLSLICALGGPVGEIIAVEDNPEIKNLMSGPLAKFSGDIYRRPGVSLIRADPAVFISRTQKKFDLIVLGQGARWGSGSASGLGVSRLLTVEDLVSLLSLLRPDGVLAASGPLMAPPRASIKLLAAAAEALKRSGAEVRNGLALIRDWKTVLILIKPRGFTETEIKEIKARTKSLGFDLSCLPGLKKDELNQFHHLAGEPLHQAASMILGGQAEKLFESAYFRLRPATRDRPYFFHFFCPRTLKLILRPKAARHLPVTEWGLLFTWGGLAIIIPAAAAGIILPLKKLKPRPRGLVYFSLIGLGYMIAEVSLLQEAIYKLGRPALAVPLVIGLFLLASGTGCLMWGQRRPGWFAVAIALALPLTLVALRHGPGAPILAGLTLVPVALLMGAPFAGGLVHLVGERAEARAWAFGVNGFFSVVGALAAALLCLDAGHFTAVLSAGACYLVAGWSFRGGRS